MFLLNTDYEIGYLKYCCSQLTWTETLGDLGQEGQRERAYC